MNERGSEGRLLSARQVLSPTEGVVAKGTSLGMGSGSFSYLNLYKSSPFASRNPGRASFLQRSPGIILLNPLTYLTISPSQSCLNSHSKPRYPMQAAAKVRNVDVLWAVNYWLRLEDIGAYDHIESVIWSYSAHHKV